MAIPTRTFSANVGQTSTGTRGPDQIETDLDALFNLFDPDKTGIDTENLKDGAATDAIIGDRTVNQAIATAYANTGTLTQILSWIVKTILAMKGTVTNWYDAGAATVSQLWGKFNDTTGHDHTGAGNNGPVLAHTGLSSIGINTHAQIDTHIAAASPHSGHLTSSHYGAASGDHDGRYYTESEIDLQVAAKNIRDAVATAADLPDDDAVGIIRVVEDTGMGIPAPYIHYGSGDWRVLGEASITDHGALSGLSDDDHPQYALDTDVSTLSGNLSTHLSNSTDPHKIKNVDTNVEYYLKLDDIGLYLQEV